jgi:glutamate decarboxylase
MRVLVKQTLGRSLTTALAQDIAEACATLEERGRLHPTVRKRVHSNTGF